MTGNGAASAPVVAAAPPPPTFGRLELVRVRDYWANEERDFTPWLAQEENLNLLGETVGLTLELVGIEQRVGPFKADIVATDGEHTVIVENQLDPTDHKHLGQLLVYAAGRQAKTVIWIAKEVTAEYRRVLDWLNEETSVKFWALEIELWRIGDSPVAPKFNVVCEPNELDDDGDGPPGELTDTKLLQLEFWKGFSEHLDTSGSSFNARKARGQHWYDLSFGTSRAHIFLHALVMGAGRLQCGLYVKTTQSEYIFDQLYTDREALDAELAVPEDVEWDPNPERLACRVTVTRAAELSNRDAWPEYYEWLKSRAESFKSVFATRVKELQMPVAEPDAGLPTAAADEVGEARPVAPPPE